MSRLGRTLLVATLLLLGWPLFGHEEYNHAWPPRDAGEHHCTLTNGNEAFHDHVNDSSGAGRVSDSKHADTVHTYLDCSSTAAHDFSQPAEPPEDEGTAVDSDPPVIPPLEEENEEPPEPEPAAVITRPITELIE